MSTGKKSLVAAIAVVLLAAGSLVWVSQAVKRETASAVVTLNPTGSTGKALLVFHPGLSDFPDRVVTGFADGLLQASWRIDRTTASRQAPTDINAYDLIVLGSPVYAYAAAIPLQDYIARVGDFHGKPVVLVFTAAGDAAGALDATAAKVASAHGKVIGRFGYTSMRPNESAKAYPGSNTERAVAMARDAARSLGVKSD
jgi:NAD(P)H-dependent FMN reductase